MTQAPVLACELLVKTYGASKAVNGVSLSVQEGEILALLGENGAGKSTVVKMLAGVVQPDGGRILLNGKVVTFPSARAASKEGIHLVHQELALLPERTVVENIFLGQEARNRFGLLDWQGMRIRAAEALARLGVSIPVESHIRELPTASQQMVEIARASVGESRVIILDEPTAALSPRDALRLFDVVREMRSRGVAFIYISHRLDEIKSLADNVVILKDGRFIARHPVEDLSQDEMVTLMVGRELKELFPVPKPKPVSDEPPVIEIVNLVDPPFVKSASFTIYAGEVVGIYGLEGHGQDQVLACLAGAHRPFSGIVKLRGQARVWTGVAGAIASGFGYVPEDRKTQGLILNLSGVRNISLPILRRRLSRLGIVAGTRETRMGMQAAKASGIRGDFSRPVNELSGGNQQKTVLARWFAARSDILLLNQPTRGVDVGAKAEIYRLVREVCSEQGAVALVVSREISELLGFCDRILVMSYGRLVGEYGRDATEEQVLATAVGGRR